MTFLSPWAGVIAAAVAVPALIALYLLKLRRKPVRVSSTLLWERATQELQVNAPLRWLRRSLLLAIQLLALASLLVAIARPAIPGMGIDSPRVVFVVDRSASMSARDVEGGGAGEGARTRLEEAKRRAGEMVRAASRASGGGGVMVVALAAEAVPLTGLDASMADARSAIAAITPTDQPADADRLFDLLAAIRAGEQGEDGSATPTSVVVFSDGDVVPREARSLPGNMTVRLERVGPAVGAGTRNVGVVALSARRDHEDPQVLRVFARVANAGAREVETIAELRIDGESADARPVAIAGAGEGGAGEQSVTFEVRRAAGGLAVVRIAGADVLASDDAAGVRVAAATRPGVVLVHPVGAAPDAAVKGLLEDLDLAWLEVLDAARFDRVNSGLEPTPGGRSVGQIDLAVMDRTATTRAPATATLSFGAAPLLEGISFTPAPVGAASGGASGAWVFTSWQRRHPLLRFASFDAVTLAAPGELVVTPVRDEEPAVVVATGEPAGAGGAGGVEGAERALIAVLERAGRRHVVVAFSPARSTWPAELSFPLVMQNAVDVLASREGALEAGPVRTVDPVKVRAAAGAGEVVVTGPLERRVAVGGEGAGAGTGGGTGGGGVELGVLELAGVYALSGVEPDQTPIAVNLLDARETAAATMDGSGLPGTGRGEGREAGTAGGRGVREVWTWFVVAGLVLATLEWVLYAVRMRA